MTIKTILKADPNNNIFDASAIRRTQVSEKGVILFSDDNKLWHFINESNPEKATHIRNEITKLLLDLQAGRNYQPDWDLPTPNAAVKSDLMPEVSAPATSTSESASSKATK